MRVTHISRLSLIPVALAMSAPVMAAPADQSPRQFDLSASINDTFDSDVLRGQAFLGSQRAVSRDDFIAAPSVNANIVLPFSQHEVFLSGTVGYEFFQKNDFLDRERINLNAGVGLRIIPGCKTTLSANYARQQSELFNVPIGFDPRNTNKVSGVGATINCNSGNGLAPTLGYHRTQTRNVSSQLSFSDSNFESYDASIGFARPALGTVSVYGNYSDITYPRRTLAAAQGGTADGTKIYSGGLRFERDLGARLRGSFSLGYTVVDPKIAGIPKSNGSTFGIALDYDSRNRLKAHLGIDRSVDKSDSFGASYGITNNYNISANYTISRPLRLTAGASQTRRDLRQSPLSPVALVNSRDRLRRVFARVDFQSGGPISLGAEISQDWRKSISTFFNYSSTRAGISATYHFSGVRR